MKRYDVVFDEKAEKQMKALAKSGRKTDLARVGHFTEEVENTPGTAPESQSNCGTKRPKHGQGK